MDRAPEKYVWYDTKQAAAYLGMTERQVRRARESGRIETTRLGGQKALHSQAALDAYVESCTTPAMPRTRSEAV